MKCLFELFGRVGRFPIGRAAEGNLDTKGRSDEMN